MKLKILIFASLLLLINQVSALPSSGGGSNIFTFDWFVELSLVDNVTKPHLSDEGKWKFDSYDSTWIMLDTIISNTAVVDDGLDYVPLLPETLKTSDRPFEPGGCADYECAAVPEPGMVGLLAIGLLAMAVGYRKLVV